MTTCWNLLALRVPFHPKAETEGQREGIPRMHYATLEHQVQFSTAALNSCFLGKNPGDSSVESCNWPAGSLVSAMVQPQTLWDTGNESLDGSMLFLSASQISNYFQVGEKEFGVFIRFVCQSEGWWCKFVQNRAYHPPCVQCTQS